MFTQYSNYCFLALSWFNLIGLKEKSIFFFQLDHWESILTKLLVAGHSFWPLIFCWPCVCPLWTSGLTWFHNEQKKRVDFKQDLHPCYPQIVALFTLALRIPTLVSFHAQTFQLELCSWCWAKEFKQCLGATKKESVSPHFQIAKRELKAWCVAEYFWQTWRCLKMWSNYCLDCFEYIL